ncbi:amino acid adenylation domain-containing protein [Streptomyces sp. HUAS CX7]|uniref:non-ribosomal peptide synthetase n=1 Tax=Streptomyces sp. HUAS CX7 TaxID=3062782 RepID=UPI0026E9C514|nr:amino acid adenylation domain-containing protein [Streptomyces sp. HUAS CX7]WKX17982.1 amino acid adenylation domain-containing protein [Streptomyces sp. HUAS CX7]
MSLDRWAALSPDERARRVGTVAGPPAEDLRDPGGPVPASVGQSAQFYVDQTVGAAPSPYAVPFALELLGDYDESALAAAVEAVAGRLPVLRSRFEADGRGALRSVVAGTPPVRVRVEHTARVWERARELAREPLRLERGGLFTAVLLRSAGSEADLLVLIGHHAVVDGMSMAAIVGMVAAAYRERSVPEGPHTPAFRALAARAADGEVGEEARAWWRGHLDGLPPARLPADRRPRTASDRHRGDHVTVDLPAAGWERLRAVAQAEGAGEAAAVLACLAAVVARHSGPADAVYGLSVTGRSTVSQLECVGPFADSVPVRVRAEPNRTVREVVRSLVDGPACGRAPYEVPFASLVRALDVPRSPGRNPLYDVLVTMDPFVTDEVTPVDDRLGWRVHGLHNGTARVGLQVTVSPRGPSARARFDFATAERSRPGVERLARAFAELVGAVTDGEEPIGSPAVPYDGASVSVAPGRRRPPAVLAGFDAAVAAGPDRVALRAPDGQLDYRTVDARSDTLAARLAARTRPGDVVACLLEHSALVPVAMLAAFKAGCVYLPVDPGLPAERLAMILGDAGARLTVRDAPGRDAVFLGDPADPGGPSGPDGDGPVPLHGGTDPAAPFVRRACESAYLMFTSGSTGRPKGVRVSHRALATFAAAMTDEDLVRPADRVLAMTATTFDISLYELLLPLTAGATVVLAGGSGVRGVGRAVRLIREGAVDVVHGTPSTMKVLMAAGWRRRDRVPRVLCGGERLPADLAGELADRGGELVNLYGPTEATVWALRERVRAEDTAAGGEPLIGAPLPGYAAWVADPETLRPLEPGVVGELCLGGPALADGYVGRPEATAKSFFASQAGPAYRTGDLARRRPDGRFEFLGRTDDQVKVRGHRVELGDVEAAARRAPGVTDAVAAVADGALRLLVVGGEEAVAAVRELLPGLLPEHMVPSLVGRADAVPLTTSGKTDRRRVAELVGGAAGGEREAGAAAPGGSGASRHEEWVRSVWSRMTGRQPVGVTDNLFEIGGHSLTAARTVALARDELGLEIDMDELFADATPRGVGRLLETATAERDALVRLVATLSDTEAERMLGERRVPGEG